MSEQPEHVPEVETLAERVRSRREALGLTREMLAQRCDVSTGFIRDVEGARFGRTGPGCLVLHRVARELGVTLDELLGGTSPLRLDGFGFLDQERVDRILAARSLSELDDLIEGGALCFGALFNGADRLVPRDDWKEIEARCIAHYASLAARERRRR